MDYFWAFVKTLGFFLCLLLTAIFAIIASLFAAPIVEIIASFLWDNGKLIGQLIFILIMVGMFVAEFFRLLDEERKKRLTTVN